VLEIRKRAEAPGFEAASLEQDVQLEREEVAHRMRFFGVVYESISFKHPQQVVYATKMTPRVERAGTDAQDLLLTGVDGLHALRRPLRQHGWTIPHVEDEHASGRQMPAGRTQGRQYIVIGQ